MTIDCRTMPSETGCTLTISGEEEEVLRAAAAHAVDVHGHTDGEELRSGLRQALTRGAPFEVGPGAFVQLIEFRTQRPEEFTATEEAWAEAIGPDRTARWAITAEDRNHRGDHVQIVGFDDYDSAMANSKHPATARFAEKLRAVSEGDPVFHDLDVRRATAF
ncbi:DUF1059 domain-containing protein [Pseudonocardia acidicola]|nr:DUF1059 domain-containing protein [Pseudonocardia acidicola]